MGIPALTWNTQNKEGVSPAEIDPILYNNAYVYDTSPASPIDGVPVELFKKTRYYTYNAGSGTEGEHGYVAPYYTVGYSSTNPHHDNMVAIKGGVYEKAEFTTCTSGGTSNPTAGVSYGNNVIFVDTGSSSPLVYGPIIAYSSGDSPQLGANIEANVGWVATTVNATAGIHTNNHISVAGNYSPSSPSYAGIPLNLSSISWTGTYGSYSGTQTASFPGVSAVTAPNISINYSTSALSPAGGAGQPAASSPVSVTGSSGSKRVEFWAPGVSSASPTSSYLRGGVEFEIAKDKKYKIKPLDALTVTATAYVSPFGVGGGRLGTNKDINTATHCKATINTIGNHNLADANNRVHITGSTQTQLNGWHNVYDVSDANTFSIVVPLSQDSGTISSITTAFTVETYDGVDKPGGVFKTPLTVDYVDEVNLYSTSYGQYSNGVTYVIYSSTQKYNYHTTKAHGFSAGDSFTTSPSSGSGWLGTKTVMAPTGSHNFDVLISSGSSSGSPSTTRRYTGSLSISGPTKGTVMAGGNAGNENVIMSHDTTMESGGQYQYYPNSSFSNVVYADVECRGLVDSDSSMFKLMGLEIDADTGRLHSNGAFDGVNNKGVRSLDSFYPKFLEAREGALNSTVTTGSVTQSNNSIILDDVERLPVGHLKTFTYSNGAITNITSVKAFSLEYANGTSYTRSGVEVENDIGGNTYTDTTYTITYVDTSWPVVNSSAHFMLEKQNNTPMVSGESIIAFVGPEDGFHIPVWSSIKASKKTSHLGSGHTVDANDYKYQDFCIKVYKSLVADRDDFVGVYSDPDNESEPVDANTAYTYVSGTQIEGQFANGDNIVTEINTPVTNSQHLANTYANGSVRHF